MVRDSNRSSWIIVVKSGSLNVLKRLKKVKPFGWRKQNHSQQKSPNKGTGTYETIYHQSNQLVFAIIASNLTAFITIFVLEILPPIDFGDNQAILEGFDLPVLKGAGAHMVKRLTEKKIDVNAKKTAKKPTQKTKESKETQSVEVTLQGLREIGTLSMLHSS